MAGRPDRVSDRGPVNAGTITSEFRRKNIRLEAKYYRGRRLYFVTLCFDRRRRFGANPSVARWLVTKLREHSKARGFLIHAYCVMPDHVHLLAEGASDESDLLNFVELLKQQTGFPFERKTKRRLWQFKYYDHILRKAEHADRVAWYIWLNPVRKGMCGVPTEYAFLGSSTEYGTKLLSSYPAKPWVPPWKTEMPR